MNFSRPNSPEIERITDLALPGELGAGQASSSASSYNRLDDALDINWLFSSLLSRIRLLLALVTIVVVLAFAYLSVAEPRYESTTELLIEVSQPRITQGEELAPGLDTGRFMIGQVIDSQIELLRSKALAEMVIRDLGLTEFAQPQPGLLRSLVSRVLGTRAASDPPEATGPQNVAPNATPASTTGSDADRKISQAELLRFLGGLDVRRVGLSLIIQVKYTHQDPEMAARIARAVASNYIADQENRRQRKATSVREWLKTRVIELQNTIAKRRQEIERYQADNNLVLSGGQLLPERELSETMAQAITARANMAALRAELRKVENRKDLEMAAQATGLSLQSAVITDYKRQQALVQRQLANTISRFGSTHPQVAPLEAELDKIQLEINLETQRLVQNLQNQYEIARTKTELLESRLSELTEEVSKSRELQIKLAEIEREVAVDSEIYASLLARLRELDLQRSLTRSVASIVEQARPAERPSHPRKMLILAGGLASALVLGSAAAILLEFFGNYLRSSSSVRRFLGIRTVVALPRTKSAGLLRKAGRRRGAQSSALEGDVSPLYAQRLFLLRQLVLPAGATHQSARIVALVSSMRGEGKTTTAVNLARYAASSGLNVLVLDCNLHDAMATRALMRDVPAMFLDQCITGDHDVDVDTAIIALENGVHLLPSRPVAPPIRPVDLLASARMEQLVEDLRARYDLVIIDTPALSTYVDAPSVAQHADCLLLVIEADRARVADVTPGLEALEQQTTKIVGAVFNKARS